MFLKSNKCTLNDKIKLLESKFFYYPSKIIKISGSNHFHILFLVLEEYIQSISRHNKYMCDKREQIT